MLQFSSRMSFTELGLIANVAVGKVKASAEAGFKEKQKNVRVRIISVGATGGLATKLISEVGDNTEQAVKNYIASGGQFSLTNPGDPIFLRLNYVGRGQRGVRDEVAVAQMVTKEGVKILRLEQEALVRGLARPT